MYLAFQEDHGIHSYIWTIWFILFAFEMWMVMGVSYFTPDIGFEDTHLVVRMGLLTLIIIGEGVIAVTRIANKTVRPGGWTKWSFVHILGVTTSVVSDISDQIRLSSTDLPLWFSTSCGKPISMSPQEAHLAGFLNKHGLSCIFHSTWPLSYSLKDRKSLLSPWMSH
jgi:hypothetical protein